MTTKKNVAAKSVKSEKENVNNAVNNVVNSVAAPVGAGTTGGGFPAAVGVGSSAASAGKAGKENVNDRVNAADVMENEMGLNDLRQKIVSYFAAPEWPGAASLRETLCGLGLDDTAVNAAVNKQAIACGWVASAPVCSVSRVLAVIRRYYAKDFEALTGVSVDALREYYRVNGAVAVVASPLLSLSAVRAGSALTDFISVSPLPAGSSASAVVASLLSLRYIFAFNRALSAARSAARSDLRNSLASCWRAAVRLGMSVDDIVIELKEVAFYTSVSDAKERETLRKNRDNAINQANAINDAILLAGGAEGEKPAKVAKLLARRARYYSVVSTCENLLKM